MSPNAKGEMGVQEAMSDFVDQGGKIYSQEVTVEINGVRNRFDFVGELDGQLHLVEVKNGLNAGFTPNQQINFPKYLMSKPVMIPRGANALKVPAFENLYLMASLIKEIILMNVRKYPISKFDV